MVLATVQVENCILAADSSPAGRRLARVENHPFVAAGSTPVGSTTWRLYPATGTIFGVEVPVDASAAGFRLTPSYFARVVGTRFLPASPLQHIVDGFPIVANASPTGFLLQMSMPRNLYVGAYQLNPDVIFTALLPSNLTTLGWRVEWIGVER